MSTIKLTQDTIYTKVTPSHDKLDTGTMGGCVTVIVHGAKATRAQHCSGGFQALDEKILDGIGTVNTIVVVAPYFAGYDWERVLEWVRDNKGTGLASYVKSGRALINLNAVRNRDLDGCFIKTITS